MAKTFLRNEISPVIAGNIYGTSGEEVALIYPGGEKLVFDNQIERIELGGNISDYTFKQSGNRIKIFQGSKLIVTAAMQSDSDGTVFAFKDGSTEAKYVPSQKQVTLGGTVIPSKGTPSKVTPERINHNDKSTVPASGTEPTTPAQPIEKLHLDNKGTINPNSPYFQDANGKDYLFIDKANQPNNLVIKNFSQGDNIQLEDAYRNSTFICNDGEDVYISINNNSIISKITLLGVVDSEAIVSGSGTQGAQALQQALGYAAISFV